MSDSPAAFTLRRHRAGDIGAIISAQARLYAEEYGWNTDFEAAIAEIGAEFLRKNDPATERAFIAEKGGHMLGAALVVRQDWNTAKLRLVHVDRAARGQGLGKRLVDESISFARDAGYRRMTLWTNDILVAAIGIYRAAGFVLVKEEPHHSFGVDLIGQNWELTL
jgi:GNAT superfamily N-acetyltransferase